MKFKTPALEDQFFSLPPLLTNLIKFTERFAKRQYGKELTITGVWRSHAESIAIYAGKVVNPQTNEFYKPEEVPFSVHEANPCRGVDCRGRDFLPTEIKGIEDHVNKNFLYDPSRPGKKCCLYHDVGKGVHFHFQVHPKTEMVADGEKIEKKEEVSAVEEKEKEAVKIEEAVTGLAVGTANKKIGPRIHGLAVLTISGAFLLLGGLVCGLFFLPPAQFKAVSESQLFMAIVTGTFSLLMLVAGAVFGSFLTGE